MNTSNHTPLAQAEAAVATAQAELLAAAGRLRAAADSLQSLAGAEPVVGELGGEPYSVARFAGDILAIEADEIEEDAKRLLSRPGEWEADLRRAIADERETAAVAALQQATEELHRIRDRGDEIEPAVALASMESIVTGLPTAARSHLERRYPTLLPELRELVAQRNGPSVAT